MAKNRRNDGDLNELEVAAWERQRNASAAGIKWMFTTEKARAKMGQAYPQPTCVEEIMAKEL